jgi:methyl-accepting chemotaxis protein-like sensor
VASEKLADVVAELEGVFGALELLARELLELAAGAEPLGRDDLASLRPAIFELLATHRGLVAGAGVITAPDLLRDAPRWLEWWWTTASGTPEALRVNLDPSAPDFYDYTTADWYATPERTLARRVAGPYVDYACTNEYAITLSLPIRSGDRVLGMAAADVLVSSLERKVLPVLAAIGHPSALASADGRVIASNSPAWAPGLRLAADQPRTAPADHNLAHPLRSWILVDLDT